MIDKEQKRLERERKKAETLAKRQAQKTMKGKGRGKKRPISESSEGEEEEEQILYDDRSDDETDMTFAMNDADMDESIYMDVDESIYTAYESGRDLEDLA